jgi:hypothetical protein
LGPQKVGKTPPPPHPQSLALSLWGFVLVSDFKTFIFVSMSAHIPEEYSEFKLDLIISFYSVFLMKFIVFPPMGQH